MLNSGFMQHITLNLVILCVIVPGPPVGILFPEVRTNSVRLIWQPPAQPNGIILGEFTLYRLFITDLGCCCEQTGKAS